MEGKRMTTLTAVQAKDKLLHILDDISNPHEPIYISGKKNSSILISIDDWRSIQETMKLNSIPGMGSSILEGLNTPISECEQDLDW
jgi:antitoxin YefM